MDGETKNVYRILVVKCVLYNNHLEKTKKWEDIIKASKIKINLLYMYLFSHHAPQRILCACFRKTKQIYELDILTCADFAGNIHPSFTCLQVFNTKLSQTNGYYIYHRV
jgi:hypothetical protein